jgi:hypothetical protein
MCTPPGGISKSSGRTMRVRAGSTSMLAEDSTVSLIVLKPIQQPE